MNDLIKTQANHIPQATILSKATEYISHLEKRNKTLMRENANLKSRVEAFEILMSRGSAAQQQQNAQINYNSNESRRISAPQMQPPRQQNYGRM